MGTDHSRPEGNKQLDVQFCDGYAYGMVTRQPVFRAVSHLAHYLMAMIDERIEKTASEKNIQLALRRRD